MQYYSELSAVLQWVAVLCVCICLPVYVWPCVVTGKRYYSELQ